jgi:hypothetical protein
MAVSFGSAAVTTGLTVNTAGIQITVKASAASAGIVDVTVTAGGNTEQRYRANGTRWFAIGSRRVFPGVTVPCRVPVDQKMGAQ